ncbi:hypothetical protein L207DRAFT_455287 [Hyaloscypha variabilis F]|uniref:Uncharacterized protein n=1 Tax=Hyaloscypha variabilis (strain UAMH 11265 / GT02V1 / F) TaxID=1149755 RepID=A0A2J6RXU4_HYAVF|nr:hypothetical protein L207DRAFT_455287 [Hyaloscypha variabilis F]
MRTGSLSSIMARGLLRIRAEPTTSMSTTMIDLLIALMVLIFLSLLLIGALYTVRKVRRNRAIARQQLPIHNESKPNSNHRRLTIKATPYGRGSSVFVYDEKSSVLSSPSSPCFSPDSVPEIRITFPDEQDESGRRKSGRVVVVRVGETGVGLEPLKDEQLPAYEKESGARFHSIDMERIGGLKEKSQWS